MAKRKEYPLAAPDVVRGEVENPPADAPEYLVLHDLVGEHQKGHRFVPAPDVDVARLVRAGAIAPFDSDGDPILPEGVEMPAPAAAIAPARAYLAAPGVVVDEEKGLYRNIRGVLVNQDGQPVDKNGNALDLPGEKSQAVPIPASPDVPPKNPGNNEGENAENTPG